MPFWKKMFNQKQAVYYIHALVDSDNLEWIELSPEAEDTLPVARTIFINKEQASFETYRFPQGNLPETSSQAKPEVYNPGELEPYRFQYL